MKELDFKWFRDDFDLIEFVKTMKIEKENIQTIVNKNNGVVLYYWREA